MVGLQHCQAVLVMVLVMVFVKLCPCPGPCRGLCPWPCQALPPLNHFLKLSVVVGLSSLKRQASKPDAMYPPVMADVMVGSQHCLVVGLSLLEH